MRNMIGTKDITGMIEDLKERTDMREKIGKVGVIRTSTKEEIEIDSIGKGNVTENEMGPKIDIETPSPTPVLSLLP